jgi:nuclear protein NHN1
MESDDDSRSSSTSGSSNSTSNGPASPPNNENGNDSNDPEPELNNVQTRSPSHDSSSFQEGRGNESIENQSSEKNKEDDDEEEEELELSDIEDESNKQQNAEISHEDLSDISDLESSNDTASQDFTDLRQKLENQRQNGAPKQTHSEKIDVDDELDFEVDEIKENVKQKEIAEEKEPGEESDDGEDDENDKKSAKEDGEHKSDKELESGEELEEGEVTDGDEKRPEETEPKAVCRFFTRGQCTWGMSCRFLHPGTTDKGNYTMFDLVRPIPQAAPMIVPAYDYRTERPPIHLPPHAAFGGPRGGPPPESESAWERGLRTAKEMMRKASKRKEQDIDFDEKKMNLSGPQEIEKDPYYARGSPDVSNVFFFLFI